MSKYNPDREYLVCKVPLGRNRVQFRRVQAWVAGTFGNIKPGVYVDGKWVGDILKGNAFFPEQITINGVTSPWLKRKADAKGNVKRVIRNSLMEWAEAQVNQ